MNKDKLITYGMWAGGLLVFILLSLMVAPAIRFFFRGVLAMMNHPIEALCFFAFLTILWTVAVKLEDR